MHAIPGLTPKQRNKMLLSPQTLAGLKFTGTLYTSVSGFIFLYLSSVHSFIELVQYLFSLEGVNVFLSQRICQDPLEKFFGCQRQRRGTNDNPNVSEFFQNTQTIRVVRGICRQSVNGNCRGQRSLECIDLPKESVPLQKRKRRRKRINTV